MSHSIRVSRRYSLSALHILQGDGFSDEENLSIFGACSRLHGHEYKIEVTVTGPIDPVSGLIIQRDLLDEIVSRLILVPMTGACLNDFFLHTTGEALAVEFYKILNDAIEPPLKLSAIKVHETAKNSFVVDG